MPKHALLFHRSRLGVALGYDQPTQRGTILARNLLPDFLPIAVAEANAPVRIALVQEDSPAIVRHAHVAISRPALGVHRSRGAQVHVGDLETLGAKLFPPLQEVRLPMFQRALQRAVRAEIDVVRDAVLVIDAHKFSTGCPVLHGAKRQVGRGHSLTSKIRCPSVSRFWKRMGRKSSTLSPN